VVTKSVLEAMRERDFSLHFKHVRE
jgi:hypothetical protein